ncbi:hypothetical protein SAFG77S_08166 [Streptomyces afghaniensis]
MDDIMNCFRFFGKIADQHPGRLWTPATLR